MHFADGLWDTKSLESHDGYHYTLTSRIGHMLSLAEQLFGKRDKAWTILGAEINMEGDAPQNWYPGGDARRHIIFQLIPPADRDITIACYQLAHEVVHALSPLIGIGANVLEEGAATLFSRNYVRDQFVWEMSAGLSSYDDACSRVEKFLNQYSDGIRRLRAIEPCFKIMTPATFSAANLSLASEDIDALLSPFKR